MTLFGCMPVCLMFVALGILGLVAYASGAILFQKLEPQPEGEPPRPQPPYWIAFAVLAVACLVLILLSFVTDG